MTIDQMSIALLTRFKNERHILREWISHHLEEGVDKIFLIDHHSDDDFYSLNKPFLDDLADADRVQILQSKDDDQDRDYNHFLPLFREYSWLAILDADEFLFCPQKDVTLKEMLHKAFRDVDYIRINWKLFSHRVRDQPRSVINNNVITHRDAKDPTSPAGVKCIGRAAHLTALHVHELHFDKNVSQKHLLAHNTEIQINHYRTQSDEFLYGVKEQRGGGVHKDRYIEKDSRHLAFDMEDTLLKDKRQTLIRELLRCEPIKPQIHPESSWQGRM